MLPLEELAAGAAVTGIVPDGPAELIAVTAIGADTVRVVYRTAGGQLGEQILMRGNEPALDLVAAERTPFDADAEEFKLAAEALRLRAAAHIDPMLAVTSSDLEPLPHQIEAVYGHLLDRVPLRFLLADDPGAGKTVMAGLYAKELMLRGDLSRCLIVAPGGLVEQWQDELYDKFALRFQLLTTELAQAVPRGENLFAGHPLLIARMDQLARSERWLAALAESRWDLVVVDEAHRMSAHYYGREVSATRRYQLGERLGEVADNLLLMTATPHAGKERDFQLFLNLLDADRFEGRYREGEHDTGADGLMLRRVKEELLTLSGTPLFPPRRAYTVPYQLSAAEAELYEAVTAYVRQEFNRADTLSGARGNTVGFALTVLQRRLASSPEAILRSLRRRAARLAERLREAETRPAALGGAAGGPVDLDEAYDDFPSAEREQREEEVVDAATAARSAEELRHEIGVLHQLVALAERVRQSGTDRKWTELAGLLRGAPEIATPEGPRKLIVFTEHRDTLGYLCDRIGELLGRPDAVVAIHGGMGRDARRAVRARFAGEPDCLVLVATDAAGEGLNLQQAHLMVNYDLPWNPNRLEQRFGRIHRIGQREMCHLWNLVAANTREGEVFQRLLAKLEEQHAALRGKVFDVLGEAFEGEPLHRLLLDAVRHGDRPEIRDHLRQVIDARVGEAAARLLDERALHTDLRGGADARRTRVDLEEARARRLQPYYVEGFFRDAFARAGGRLTSREAGRYAVPDVPRAVRERRTRTAPIPLRYERVCFDRAATRLDGRPTAELLAPGHPLLDAVVAHTLDRYAPALERGAVLIDRLDRGEEHRLLVAVGEEVVDSRDRVVARRFGFLELWPDGRSRDGAAPFLDYAAPEAAEQGVVAHVCGDGWPADAREVAERWATGQHLPDWYASVSARRRELVERTRGQVRDRLDREIAHWRAEADRLAGQLVPDASVREKRRHAEQRVGELTGRRERRLAELTAEAHTQTRPPSVAALALVLPQGLVDRLLGRTVTVPDTTEAERRAVEAVLRAERALGREPELMAHHNPGYDIRSTGPDGHLVHIEVKGREPGAADFFVTNREIRVGQNAGDYRLALVEVDPERSPGAEELRYLRRPFADEKVSALVSRVQFKWADMWQRGGVPS
ncbi:helicase-related protein [Micromonospora sp. CPCC 205711]|uniref:helicase-related protein n=1 Tax=Micromonospora sp. CPCC 205547 TaxID=3122400 RepID=UPI002FF34FE5